MGKDLCKPQNTAPTNRKDAEHVYFNQNVEIQKPLEELPVGMSVGQRRKSQNEWRASTRFFYWTFSCRLRHILGVQAF